MNNKKVAAFFDFDLTITNYDSFRSYIFFLYLRHPQNYIYIPYIIYCMILKKLNFISLYEIKGLLLSAIKNKTIGEINKLSERYLLSRNNCLFNDIALKKILEHQNNGDLIFIISSSPDVIFEQVKNKIKPIEIISNELKFKDERFTGTLTGLDCYGENKKTIIKSLANKYNIDREKSFAYSDHYSDIPMLSLVGNPSVVNPNSPLKLYAKKLDWPIEYWINNAS
jgi:HAD superfamily hydrolase (TIGR01490 family)